MMKRYNKAKNTYDKPVFIITEEEAVKNSINKSTAKKTWKLIKHNFLPQNDKINEKKLQR